MKYLVKFESYGLKGKDPFVFVRFGGLDLKNQKGYTSKESEMDFHTPPKPRGIYAMPKIAQEFFLIGSLDKTQKGIFKKNADDTDFIKKLRQIRKEFRKDSGDIWHHLIDYVDNIDIIERKGQWIKTDIKVWAKAFSKMSTELRYGRSKWDLQSGIKEPGIGKGITGYYSKDHCEVFFDEKT